MKKKQRNIFHFFGNTKDNAINDISNKSNMCTPFNHEHNDELKPPQFSSGTFNKEIGTEGGENEKLKVWRKCDSSYLKFGFIQEPGRELDLRALCVVCSDSLSNDAIKPSKLLKHLRSKLPQLSKKSL